MLNKKTPTPMLRHLYKLIAGGVFFCLIVILLNTLLGILNLEQYDKEFNPKSSYPIYVSGIGDQSQNFERSSHFKYALNYQTFPKKKADGTIRIFVVGGSAAYAWPFTEGYGFSGYLRRVLNRLDPGKYEIINSAGMSYGSHRVFDVLQDVVRFEPDLVIIYSGNNEYVEKNVIAGGTKETRIFDSVSRLLGQTNLYRAVRLFLFRAAPAFFQQKMKQDLTDLRADSFVNRGELSRNPQVDKEVYENYSVNISKMKETLSAAGVKGIFCTAPSNIADWHPEMTSPQFSNEEQAASWRKIQSEVLEALEQPKLDSSNRDSSLPRQKELLLEMLRLAPDHPGTLYLLGQVQMRLGEYESAYSKLVQAKDLDARPVRALTSFNNALRTMINGNSDQNKFALVDLDDALGGEVRRGAPNGIFLDYCHLTEDAHRFVAILMLPAINKMMGLDLPLDKMSEWISLDNWGGNKDAGVLANVYYAQGITLAHNGANKEAEEAFLQVLKLESETSGPFVSGIFVNLSNIYLAQGDYGRYKDVLYKALAAYPEDQVVLIKVGFLYLEEENNLEKAAEMFNKAIRLNSYVPGAFDGLGRIAMQKGLAEEAIKHYQQALRLVEDNPTLQKDLGKAYLANGERDKAILSWRAALSLDSSDQEILDLLKKYDR